MQGNDDATSLQNKDCRFKQAKEGECTVAKPSFYQLTEKSKWNAWKELAGMGRAEAMNQYVEKVVKRTVQSFSCKIIMKDKRICVILRWVSCNQVGEMRWWLNPLRGGSVSAARSGRRRVKR